MVIKKNIIKNAVTVILCAYYSLLALSIDTTIVGDGTPGPYPLGRYFVDTSSISVSFVDSALGNVPPFVYVEKVNGLLFSEILDSGVILKLHYTTNFYGLQKTYSLYERHIIDLSDTTRKHKKFDPAYRPSFADENINISGFKSIGVSFGSQGQLNMEQALEVRIFGKINENTELSANLSDQTTSLEGDTREIGEIDRMYVALKNPKYTIVAGDQFVQMPTGGLIDGFKKIKGLSAAFTGEQFQASAYGAISGGKYTVQTIKGQLGFQGPYYLTGQGEADIINPIRGTIKVIVDGNKLKEGEDRDFIVDYDIGTISFMPTFPIDDNSIIQVYYEYKSFDYQRAFLGTDIGVITPDSTLSVKGVVWYETDNMNHPIDLDLDDVTINSLKQSGDETPLVPNGRRIHPNDVSTKDAVYRLYKIMHDTTSGDSFYVYTPYNSANPLDNKDFYQVWFEQVPYGSGDYIRFTDTTDSLIIASIDSTQLLLINQTLNKSDPRGPAHYYVGPGKGNYTSLSPAPAPRRTVKGEVTAFYKPRDWLSLSTNIAGEEEDKNLFSNKDDKDNTASASQSTFQVGRKVFDEKCVWLSGMHSFSSRRFSREVLTQYERRGTWDREHSSVLGNEIHAWQVTSGSTIIPKVSADISYGQYISNKDILTQRIGYSTLLAPWKHLSIDYSGMFLNHLDSSDTEKLLRDTVTAIFDYKHLNYSFRFDDEWQKHASEANRGKIGGGLDILVKPISLTESVYYSQERKGGRSIFLPLESESKDTGSIFLWKQGIALSPTSTWKFSGSSSYHLQKREYSDKSEGKQSILLISVSNDIASVKTGFSTHQDYRLSSERASMYVQVPIYLGEGRGTHSYDSTLNEYVPDRLGDYIIQEREVFNSAGTENIRKSTFQGSWFFKPHSKKIKGILADISWNGSFMIDEHIRLDSALVAKDEFPKSTWVPGYSSLAGKNDTLITFSDIFYRQDMDWRPKFTEGLHGNFNIRPFLRKIRNHDENGVEVGTYLDKRWTKWKLKGEGRIHTLNRSDKWGLYTTEMKDRFFGAEQRYYFVPAFSIFANENIGNAERAEKESTSGPYFRLQPGLSLRLIGKGWAELSYTWSQVNIDGEIEYPMAQGFATGTSHVIDFMIDINAGDHFTISGNYRGDYNEGHYKKWLHVVSMEVKAFL